MESLTIDCDSCAVRGTGCDGCVITVLLGSRPDEEPVVLDGDERRALTALAGSGLLPPLRMAPGQESTG